MRLLAPLAILAAGCVAAPALPPPDTPATLAAAESAFAAQSVREGMRAAFLAWLAPGAVLFRTGPVDGPAEIARNPDPPIVLDWRPAYVEVSASGELGLSTGPWRIRSKADPSRPERFGQFISLWRRPPGGTWRVWVDLGIAHPGPALWDAPLEAGFTPPAAGAGSVDEAEAAFARLAHASGHAAAYAAWASPSVRVYRNGKAPFLGLESTLGSPAALGHAQWTIDRHETSQAGDLGFAIGRFGPAKDAKAGDFVRVWRREAAGWRIALDVVDEVKAK
ncbi:MAG: nuclear transport factor 2 family protein [Betaproteobacteria bacterium]|nr:nuclear transport factor 2 family protein [Betaproteobacteria bacterium]